MRKGSVEEVFGLVRISKILKQVIEICSQDDQVDKVILHGSWAKGTAMERSDIDLALVGDEIDIEELQEEVEEIDTLYKIDLVDVSHCRNDLLQDEVEKYGIEIYSKV